MGLSWTVLVFFMALAIVSDWELSHSIKNWNIMKILILKVSNQDEMQKL